MSDVVLVVESCLVLLFWWHESCLVFVVVLVAESCLMLLFWWHESCLMFVVVLVAQVMSGVLTLQLLCGHPHAVGQAGGSTRWVLRLV